MNQTPWLVTNKPEDAGISSKGLLTYLDEVEKSGLEHHSIMIYRHGKLALSMNWKPYCLDMPHMLFSLSKSFCSAAAGFAVAEGLLSWDSKVYEVLSEHAPENPSELQKKITLSHLLMMGSGLDEKSDTTETVAQTLAYDCIREPGSWFHYNSHGTMLVSAMVQKVTGMNIRDYLIPRLFAPLGIATPEWDKNSEGICWGGWGLHLTTEDILRFGICLLNHGKWQGVQVLPEGWVELASQKHIDNSNGNPDPNNEWNQGYGYQFWRTRGGRYRGDGAFGQICMISEEQDMVVAITAGIDNMGAEMELLHRFLFPAADMEPGTEEDTAELKRRVEALAYPALENDGSGTLEAGEYVAESGNRLIVSLPEENIFDLTYHFTITKGDEVMNDRIHMVIHPGEAVEGDVALGEEGMDPRGKSILYGGWQKGILHFLVRLPGAPFTVKAQIIPGCGSLTLKLGGTGFPTSEETLRKA